MRAWTRWQDWINMLAGAWLFATPWIFGYATAPVAAWNAWVVGIVMVLGALWALSAPAVSGAEWFDALVGAWTFISPWVLGFAVIAGAAWNAWIVGAFFLIVALSAVAQASRATSAPQRT